MGEPASGGEPVSVFESGESLLYLGEITGQFFGPRFAIAQICIRVIKIYISTYLLFKIGRASLLSIKYAKSTNLPYL